MRVHLVDPAAYTPPYDRALASALARAGAETELWTSAFRYGDVPPVDPAVRVVEAFYRRGGGRFARVASHVPDMLRYRRAARAADVVHFQWLSIQALDARLLPDVHPRLLTAHDVLPREPRPGQLAGQRALYERMDGIVVHSSHGAARLRDELGLDPARVHVIPHGVLSGLDVPGEAPFAAAGQAGRALLRAAAALQGRRRPARRVARGGAGRRAVGDRDAAHGRLVHPRPERAHGAALRLGRRARGRVPRGRSRRAALPRDRPVGRALHGAGVRQAGAGDDRRRLRGDPGRGARPTGRSGRARRRADSRCWPTRRVWREMADASRAAAEGPYSWDAIAARTLELYAALQA